MGFTALAPASTVRRVLRRMNARQNEIHLSPVSTDIILQDRPDFAHYVTQAIFVASLRHPQILRPMRAPQYSSSFTHAHMHRAASATRPHLLHLVRLVLFTMARLGHHPLYALPAPLATGVPLGLRLHSLTADCVLLSESLNWVVTR
jgi:hypothetical protein